MTKVIKRHLLLVILLFVLDKLEDECTISAFSFIPFDDSRRAIIEEVAKQQ